ncbi:MAG: hypothetical protein M3367_01360 [Acidobacteriota bacterium]|nr:hypothetical protein [Acidobacteriota bacterium]
MIYQLAKEHGVREKVEAVCGVSFDVELEKEFDIVVSETIGYLGYDENIVEIMRDARTRFLKKGGLLIPETVSLFAAAGHLKTEMETIPDGLPFNFKILADLNLNSPLTSNENSRLELITEPRRLIESDLYKTNEQPSLENLRAEWKISNAEPINCFIVWVESRLTENINLSTRETTAWQPNIYRIKPVEGAFDEVEFNLSLTRESNYWTVIFTNVRTKNTQSYSPEFAASELTLFSRTENSDLIEKVKMGINM